MFSKNLTLPFIETVAVFGPKTAVIVDVGSFQRSVSFNQLGVQVSIVLEELIDQGLAPGSSVALNINDPLLDLIAFIALTSLGVGIYVVSDHSRAEEETIRRLGIKTVITDKLEERTFLDKIVVESLNENQAVLLHDKNVCARDPTEARNLPWMFLSSSGTTGTPKIMRITHEQAMLRRRVYESAIPKNLEGVFYSLTTLRFFSARSRYFSNLCRGMTILLTGNLSTPEEMVQIINRHRVSDLFCVPMHLGIIAEYQAKRLASAESSYALIHQPSIEVTSAPVHPDIKKKSTMLVSPNLTITYGTSEVGTLSSTYGTSMPDANIFDVGRINRHVDVSIASLNSLVREPNTQGQIAARYINQEIAVDYLNYDGQWISAIKNGWFYTGDIGYISDVGHLVYLGRIDDLIIFNGINIFPIEIEEAIRAENYVIDVCAFGLPSRISHQIPCAAIVTQGSIQIENLLQSVRHRLGSRAPIMILKLDEFPRNPMGKILRKNLVEIALKKLEKN